MNSIRLYLVRRILCLIPETRCFGLKRKLYRWAGATIEEGVRINSSAIIMGAGSLSIGANTWIGPEAFIACSEEIIIGKNCDIAPRVFIGDGTHVITPEKDHIAGVDVTNRISIGDGCWLCVYSTILPGVSIGRKSIVAAGAVVIDSFDDLKLIGGVPAKIINSLEEL